jgi:hypothetical protein
VERKNEKWEEGNRGRVVDEEKREAREGRWKREGGKREERESLAEMALQMFVVTVMWWRPLSHRPFLLRGLYHEI